MLFSFLKLLSRLPLAVLYAVAYVLYPLVRLVYRRRLVLKNLTLIFPNKEATEINRIANQFYKNFCEVMVEVLKSISISPKSLGSRITFKNPEITFELQKQNKPLLFFASHQANWEWMAQASALKLSVPGDVIYKPLDNKKADQFGVDLRSRFGGSPISKEVAAKEILRSKNTHRIIGLVADQSPPRDHVYWAKFCGIESDFYPGLVQLPYLMQAEAVFGKINRTKKGHYEVELVSIGSPPYAKGDTSVLQRYIEESEKQIREHPEDYLWTHNRWKHTRNENEELIIFHKN